VETNRIMLNPQDKQLLKEVLSVPTKTYKEGMMVEFICNWLQENNIPHFVDEMMNVYATKQTGENVEYFPCVVSHTDTVHNLDSINVVEEQLLNAQNEEKLSFKAYNDHGRPTGIGGDDKCGVFACMKMLQETNDIKAAFFVAEETGCHGSIKADEGFFSNVGYVIEFDAPENWMVTQFCFGQELFERDSEFFSVCDSILTESTNNRQEYMVHPYTDVWALRQRFDFMCINFSIGYYDYHSPNEYVVLEDVFTGIEMGKQMVERLGNNLHYMKRKKPNHKNVMWG